MFILCCWRRFSISSTNNFMKSFLLNLLMLKVLQLIFSNLEIKCKLATCKYVLYVRRSTIIKKKHNRFLSSSCEIWFSAKLWWLKLDIKYSCRLKLSWFVGRTKHTRFIFFFFKWWFTFVKNLNYLRLSEYEIFWISFVFEPVYAINPIYRFL